eukprot:544427_1
MPRGYLKHNKEIGKKKARGGSSGTRYADEKDPHPRRNRSAVADFVVDAPTVNKNRSFQKSAAFYPTGECVICFKEAPVVCLSKTCRWHDAACHQCLHRIHVTNAQKSAKSYPLTCFHPLCDQPVQAAQLEKHNLFASPAEAKKHHDLTVLSKIAKTD